jgi:hypothetical protein
MKWVAALAGFVVGFGVMAVYGDFVTAWFLTLVFLR